MPHSSPKRKNSENDGNEVTRRKQIALQRWRILGEILRGASYSETQQSSASVRRFQSFGLFQTHRISSNDEDNGAPWFEYSCPLFGLSLKVRLLPGTADVKTLLGFNNTGNVCIWPSEEVMAFYCLTHKELFRGKTVCELGGGMTCLAGMCLAVTGVADQVVLTDGNDDSVMNLSLMVEKNSDDLKQSSVSSRVLRWGADSTEDFLEAYDCVICADCLFFEEGRDDLVRTIYSLLKPEGKAFLFAPARGSTFQEFVQLAKEKFDVQVQENYNDHIWDLHSKLRADDGEMYDENLHYPMMILLHRPLSPPGSRSPSL